MIAQKSFFLDKFKQIARSNTASGFTLTELLVTIVIAGFAMTGLLAAMIELLTTDQQEATREETQQEMQTALSFLAEDLRESVYVYDGSQLRGTPAVAVPYDTLPNFSSVGTPIIAFWKAEPLNASQQTALAGMNCNTTFSTNSDKRAECENLKLKRRAYSLVVYLQTNASDPNGLWKGRSRILRYELPQYRNSTFSNLTWSTGFVDPARTNNFPGWPFDAQNTNNSQTSLPLLSESPAEVLVDFVDDPSRSTCPTNVPGCPLNVPSCPTNYTRSPSTNSTTTTNNSFFVCVRNVGNDLGQNQDIIVYLRGNTYGKNKSTEDNLLSTMQTRVTLRGVIDKFN
jgi:prepilin-type N-terminal cleavage/methylation domain-containing protein